MISLNLLQIRKLIHLASRRQFKSDKFANLWQYFMNKFIWFSNDFRWKIFLLIMCQVIPPTWPWRSAITPKWSGQRPKRSVAASFKQTIRKRNLSSRYFEIITFNFWIYLRLQSFLKLKEKLSNWLVVWTGKEISNFEGWKKTIVFINSFWEYLKICNYSIHYIFSLLFVTTPLLEITTEQRYQFNQQFSKWLLKRLLQFF